MQCRAVADRQLTGKSVQEDGPLQAARLAVVPQGVRLGRTRTGRAHEDWVSWENGEGLRTQRQRGWRTGPTHCWLVQLRYMVSSDPRRCREVWRWCVGGACAPDQPEGEAGARSSHNAVWLPRDFNVDRASPPVGQSTTRRIHGRLHDSWIQSPTTGPHRLFLLLYLRVALPAVRALPTPRSSRPTSSVHSVHSVHFVHGVDHSSFRHGLRRRPVPHPLPGPLQLSAASAAAAALHPA